MNFYVLLLLRWVILLQFFIRNKHASLIVKIGKERKKNIRSIGYKTKIMFFFCESDTPILSEVELENGDRLNKRTLLRKSNKN